MRERYVLDRGDPERLNPGFGWIGTPKVKERKRRKRRRSGDDVARRGN